MLVHKSFFHFSGTRYAQQQGSTCGGLRTVVHFTHATQIKATGEVVAHVRIKARASFKQVLRLKLLHAEKGF